MYIKDVVGDNAAHRRHRVASIHPEEEVGSPVRWKLGLVGFGCSVLTYSYARKDEKHA